MPGGPVQIHPMYKMQADHRFLKFYPHHFNDRLRGYVHWTAGRREGNSDHYHRVVTEVNGVPTVHDNCSGDLRAYKDQHTYARNRGAFGIAVASMYDATTEDFGDFAPTFAQLTALQEHLVKVCLNYHVPVGHLMSHQEAADNEDYSNPFDDAAPHDPYGPIHGSCERWDFWCQIDPGTLELVPTSRAAWKVLKTQITPGKYPSQPAFMDWLRGTIFLQLAERTRKYWDPKVGGRQG